MNIKVWRDFRSYLSSPNYTWRFSDEDWRKERSRAKDFHTRWRVPRRKERRMHHMYVIVFFGKRPHGDLFSNVFGGKRKEKWILLSVFNIDIDDFRFCLLVMRVIAVFSNTWLYVWSRTDQRRCGLFVTHFDTFLQGFRDATDKSTEAFLSSGAKHLRPRQLTNMVKAKSVYHLRKSQLLATSKTQLKKKFKNCYDLHARDSDNDRWKRNIQIDILFMHASRVQKQFKQFSILFLLKNFFF